MFEAGNDFGPSTQYGRKQTPIFSLIPVVLGSALIKCGQSHQKLGLAYKEHIQSAAVGFMQPLKSFLDGEMKSLTVMINWWTRERKTTRLASLQKERRTLEVKRLDLDAARSKKKKSRTINSQVPAAMADVCQDKPTLSLADRIFLRRVPIQNSAMLKPTSIVNWKSRVWCSMDWTTLTYVRTHGEISPSSASRLSLSSQHHHLRCLNDLVESELQYHRQSVQVLEDLRRQLG